MRLGDLGVVDVYIGHDYCDLKGQPGSEAARFPAGPELARDVAIVREMCLKIADSGRPEFALTHDGHRYRATTFVDIDDKPVFVLSRAANTPMPLAQLALPAHVKEMACHPATTGLVLVVGPMASGKTTTATSILVERLTKNGGLALALEDPQETNLNGLHGEGRCIQCEASRHQGGYSEYLTRGFRSRTHTIYLSEIREKKAAEQALFLGSTGHLVLTTIHGGSIPLGIQRFCRIIEASDGAKPEHLLAESLAMVIFQKLIVAGDARRLISKSLTFATLPGRPPQPYAAAARALVREGRYDQLATAIEAETARSTWS
jgi:twitching motility protein PilT